MSTRRTSGPPARCLSLLERLSGYIDHELTPRQRRAIELHCRDCARCRMMVASLRRTVALCRSSRTIGLPERVRARARARITKVLNELAEQ